MTAGKHDLIHEFPEFRERIHELKLGDAHFARLFAEYHELDHEVHRIEQGVETPSDVYCEELKKKRAKLKDELYARFSAGA
ncbi:MAG: YdcH family protein [Nevskia sp.]|nr:YdcH family protein [Nevskia sp.]